MTKKSTAIASALFAGISLLSACGGGGGTSSGGTSSAASSSSSSVASSSSSSTASSISSSSASSQAPEAVPLKLTSSNLQPAGELAIGISEALLQTAQLAVDAIDQTRINGLIVSSSACANGSGHSANYTLTDNDGNGKPSSGDTIRVSYTSCYQNGVDDWVNGDMVITLVAPAATTGWDGAPSYAAGIQFISPFTIGSLSQVSTVSGTLNVAMVRSGLQSTVSAISSTADDWVTTVNISGKTYVEAAKAIQSSKLIDYSSARTYPTLSLTLQSQALGGSLKISTPTQLTGYFGTYPDQGRVEITGASQDLVRYVPRVYPGNSTVDIYLYSVGNTQIPATIQISDSWPNFTSGFLWWDPLTQPVVFAKGYLSKEFNGADFSVLFSNLKQNTSVQTAAAPLYFQFSHKLNISNLPTITLSGPSTSIPISVSVDGARLTIIPQQPLQSGVQYSLLTYGSFFDQNVNGLQFNGIGFTAQ